MVTGIDFLGHLKKIMSPSFIQRQATNIFLDMREIFFQILKNMHRWNQATGACCVSCCNISCKNFGGIRVFYMSWAYNFDTTTFVLGIQIRAHFMGQYPMKESACSQPTSHNVYLPPPITTSPTQKKEYTYIYI